MTRKRRAAVIGLFGFTLLMGGLAAYLMSPAAASASSTANTSTYVYAGGGDNDDCQPHDDGITPDWRDGGGHKCTPTPKPTHTKSMTPTPTPTRTHATPPPPSKSPTHKPTMSASPTKSHTMSPTPTHTVTPTSSTSTSTPTQPPATGTVGPGGNTGAELVWQRSIAFWVTLGVIGMLMVAAGYGGLYWWRRREATQQ